MENHKLVVFTFFSLIIVILCIFFVKFKKSYGVFNFSFDIQTKKYDLVSSHACNLWSSYIDKKDIINVNIHNSNTNKEIVGNSKKYGNNEGSIYLNTKVFDKLSFNKQVQTLVHEIGHLLGIGTHSKWINNVKDNYLDVKNLHNCRMAYNKIQTKLLKKDVYFTKIPLTLENEGKGSVNTHWRVEDSKINGVKVKGLKNDIMAHSISGNGIISAVTTGFLKDIGYDIIYEDIYY